MTLENDTRMIVGYIRQSKEKETDISPALQKERIEEYGAVDKWYIDIDYTGKNANRPDFQRMLKDCKNHAIKEIRCYKLTRYFRSASEFFAHMDLYKTLDIQFVSVTERFDTNTPTGRAAMGMSAVFAEFDNDVRAEWIRDSLLVVAKRGGFTGGRVNFGYRKIDGKLVIYEEEAEMIRRIYQLIPLGHSLRKIAMTFNEEGKLLNGRYWYANDVGKIARNPIYYGFKSYNKTKKIKDKIYNRPPEEHILVKGEQPAIVTQKEFYTVNAVLSKHGYRKSTKRTLLAGIIFCGKCGKRMMLSGYRRGGKEYFYYLCSLRGRIGKCDMPRVYYKTIEEETVKRVMLFAKKVIYKGHFGNENKKKLKEIDKKLLSLDREVDRLIAFLGKGTLPVRAVEKRIAEINVNREQLTKGRETLESDDNLDEAIIMEEAKKIEKWETLSFEERRTAIHLLIKRITVRSKTEFDIEYF